MKLSNIFNRRNRILLAELVRTDFKLRYQGSILGYFWSILKPLFLFAILYIVFDQFLGFGRDIDNYPIYLLMGIVLWTFFNEATSNGLRSIVSKGDLIRKINFPKYILVLSGTLSSLINLGINSIVLLVFIIFSSVGLSFSALLYPVIVINLYIFSLSVAFLLASLYVRFRDVSYLWQIVLQAMFYITPILYSVQMILEKSELAAFVLLASPVAQSIQDARFVVMGDQVATTASISSSNPLYIAVPYLIIITAVVLGSFYFKRSSKKFAEDV